MFRKKFNFQRKMVMNVRDDAIGGGNIAKSTITNHNQHPTTLLPLIVKGPVSIYIYCAICVFVCLCVCVFVVDVVVVMSVAASVASCVCLHKCRSVICCRCMRYICDYV